MPLRRDVKKRRSTSIRGWSQNALKSLRISLRMAGFLKISLMNMPRSLTGLQKALQIPHQSFMKMRGLNVRGSIWRNSEYEPGKPRLQGSISISLQLPQERLIRISLKPRHASMAEWKGYAPMQAADIKRSLIFLRLSLKYMPLLQAPMKRNWKAS